jgi:hypothetical protein
MLKFSKLYGQVLFFMMSFCVVVNCYALTGTVTVTVSPGHKTVKTRVSGSAEVIGTNTAEYGITAKCDPKSGPNEEVKAVEPSWSIYSSVAFVPPQGVIPVPTNPGNPSVNVSGSGGNWTAKVYTPNAGQWKIIFTVKSVYKLKNSVTNKYIYNADGSIKTQEFTGTESCTFKATNAQFKMEIKPEDDFIGNRSSLGIGEPAEVVVSKWEQTDPAVVFISMTASGTNSATPPTDTLVNLSVNSFNAGHYAGAATLTVNVTVGGTPATDSIGVTVIEPDGAIIVQANGTFKWHKTNTGSIGFKGTSCYLPDTVSFWRVSFREGWCKATADGYLKFKDGEEHEENVNNWWTCEKGISSVTNRPNTENSIDTIRTGEYTTKPYSNGIFTWRIPWYFKIGAHSGTISTVTHGEQINSGGDATISKGGTTKHAAYGDRNSTFSTGPDQ